MATILALDLAKFKSVAYRYAVGKIPAVGPRQRPRSLSPGKLAYVRAK